MKTYALLALALSCLIAAWGAAMGDGFAPRAGAVDVLVATGATRFGHYPHPVYTLAGTLHAPGGADGPNDAATTEALKAEAMRTFDLKGRHFILKHR